MIGSYVSKTHYTYIFWIHASVYTQVGSEVLLQYQSSI